MDPNAGKRDLVNKLDKERLRAKLEAESFNRITLSFYKYVIIDNPQAMRTSSDGEHLRSEPERARHAVPCDELGAGDGARADEEQLDRLVALFARVRREVRLFRCR